MKKGILFSLVLAFGIFFLSPVSALAVDYQIDHMQIDAYLQKNGDVNVKEKQLYTFDGKHNGIERTLIPKKGSSIQNVEATKDGNQLKVKESDDTYKIFQKGSDDQVPFTLRYTIKDGVERYQDMGQFYWPFYDSNNESDYEQVDIAVHPPEATDSGISFGYDSANAKTTQAKDGTQHFNLDKVKAGKNGDIRVGFDADLFPNAKHVKSESIKAKLKKEESKQQTKRVKHAQHKQFWHQLAQYISSFFLLFMLISFMFAWQKKRQRDLDLARMSTSAFQVPKAEISMPALLAFKHANTLDANGIIAALLDLVRKGYVKQEKEDTFTVVNRDTDFEHETFLMHWLFDRIGENGVFRFDDVDRYVESYLRSKQYALEFDDWLQTVVDEVKASHLREKVKKKRIFMSLVNLLTLPFVVIFAIYGLNGWMSVLITIMIGLGLFTSLYRPKTFKGKKIADEWADFEERYANMDVDEWQELSDDAQKRATIYGIGMNLKEINDQQKEWLEKDPNFAADRSALLLYFTSIGMGYSIFYNANTITHAGSTANGAGFGNAGGGGVGGGGGGSGAF